MIFSLFTRKNPARELALRSHEVREARWIAKRNATTAKLCAEMGKELPKVFAEGRA